MRVCVLQRAMYNNQHRCYLRFTATCIFTFIVHRIEAFASNLNGNLASGTCFSGIWKSLRVGFGVMVQALYKHQGAELKSLKTALEQRDAQLEEYETQLRREHEEASTTVSSFQQQITSLKGNKTHQNAQAAV